MVKLRLRRMGRKKRPVYDIVASDSRTPRDGRFIEKIGQYNPLAPGQQVVLKRDRAMHWISVGAQPTDTVHSLLAHEGVMLEIALRHKGLPAEEIAQKVADHHAKHVKIVAAPPIKKAAPAVDAPVIPEQAPAAAVEEVPAAVAEEAPAAAVEEVPAAVAEEAPVAAVGEAPAADAAPAEENN